MQPQSHERMELPEIVSMFRKGQPQNNEELLQWAKGNVGLQHIAYSVLAVCLNNQLLEKQNQLLEENNRLLGKLDRDERHYEST